MNNSAQNWKKKSQIYHTRAQCPVVLKTIEGPKEIWRIFFSDRNARGQAFIRYIDVDPDNPEKILFESKESVLAFGPLGSFDCSGQMATSIIVEGVGSSLIYYLFYIGWSQRQDVPYHNAIGLAASYDGKNFTKVHPGPVIGTSKDDPFFTGTAGIVRKSSGGYECYYLSCTGWESDGNKLEPTYNIKRALSMRNPSMWIIGGKENVIVDFKSPDEGGICNASVIISPDHNRHMWYCYRKKFDYRTNKDNSYRIGYALGSWIPPTTWDFGKVKWERRDEEVGLSLSDSGWDSEMLCYPHVIQHNDQLIMFYNGNGFGETGFGYATGSLPTQ